MSIKVLHLIDSGGLYGAEKMLLNLVEEQIKSGLEPLILSTGTPDAGEKPLEVEAKKRGLPVKAVRMKAGINLPAALRVMKFAQAEGFHVLHSHGYKFNILFGMFPRSIRKIPLVTTLHGYVGAPRFSKLKIYQFFESRLLCRFDGIIFVSSAIRKNPLLRKVRVQNEATILNGINTQEVIRLARCSGATSIKDIFLDYAEDNIYLGAIGRLSQEKGFEMLTEVFGNLAKRYSGIHLVIIGEGGLRSSLEAKIKALGLSRRVKLPGFVNPPYCLISELDGVVMPSFSEGLPMTLLEACVLGKRIVATNVGSIPEVLDDYGYARVISPHNSTDLEEAIETLIVKKCRIENGVRARLNDEFLSSRMAEKYQSFYERVVESQV